MPRVACPSCRGTELVAYCTEARVWAGDGWESTGEIGRKWISCSTCGHTWRTKRPLSELEKL